jgi:hypothetical protein
MKLAKIEKSAGTLRDNKYHGADKELLQFKNFKRNFTLRKFQD